METSELNITKMVGKIERHLLLKKDEQFNIKFLRKGDDSSWEEDVLSYCKSPTGKWLVWTYWHRGMWVMEDKIQLNNFLKTFKQEVKIVKEFKL